MTTDLVSFTSDVRVAQVLEAILSGKAKNVKEACALVGVPRSTFYALLQQGQGDTLLAELKQGVLAEVVAQVARALPDIIAGLIADARSTTVDEDGNITGLSARDRQDARRTLLAFYKNLSGGEAQPEEVAEDARGWLAKRQFSPVQINVQGDLVVGEKQSPPTVEGDFAEVVENS